MTNLELVLIGLMIVCISTIATVAIAGAIEWLADYMEEKK